jgi:hypothetical protein
MGPVSTPVIAVSTWLTTSVSTGTFFRYIGIFRDSDMRCQGSIIRPCPFRDSRLAFPANRLAYEIEVKMENQDKPDRTIGTSPIRLSIRFSREIAAQPDR